MANMHGDHAASCLCCKNLDMGFEGDWSDVTPGRGWYCDCAALKFSDLDSSELHKLAEIAINCDSFEGR